MHPPAGHWVLGRAGKGSAAARTLGPRQTPLVLLERCLEGRAGRGRGALQPCIPQHLPPTLARCLGESQGRDAADASPRGGRSGSVLSPSRRSRSFPASPVPDKAPCPSPPHRGMLTGLWAPAGTSNSGYPVRYRCQADQEPAWLRAGPGAEQEGLGAGAGGCRALRTHPKPCAAPAALLLREKLPELAGLLSSPSLANDLEKARFGETLPKVRQTAACCARGEPSQHA